MEKGFYSFEFSGEIQFFTQACFLGHGTLLGVVWNIHACIGYCRCESHVHVWPKGDGVTSGTRDVIPDRL